MWCDSLPPTRVYGLGQQAASMLAAYSHATSVLDSISTIHSMHGAITQSKPPLRVRSRLRQGQQTYLTTPGHLYMQRMAASAQPLYLRPVGHLAKHWAVHQCSTLLITLSLPLSTAAQGFQPGPLHRIAQGAHQEAAGLAKQVATLQQAIELMQRSGTTTTSSDTSVHSIMEVD